MLNTFINGLSNIEDWIENLLSAAGSVFEGVDFSDLIAPLFPADIARVAAGVILVMIFLAMCGLVRKVLIFMG